MSIISFKKKFRVHFIGIGGVSMSALAKYLIIEGFTVSGSDRQNSNETQNLAKMGAVINIGHRESNVFGADLVVFNSAITHQNPECSYALRNKIPLISRAELLQMIARQFKFCIGIAGSHGKTTVTSIIAHIFMYSNLSFTAHIGGHDKLLGNLAVFGSDVFLSEVCEFNKNINLFEPNIAVCLNIDNDHLNCYGDVKFLQQTMFKYLKKAQTSVINIDDNYLSEYLDKAVTFGANKGDYHLQNISYIDNSTANFDVIEHNGLLFNYTANLAKFYTLHNILGAICTARQLNISKTDLIDGLNSFTGVARRNECLGTIYNKPVYIDYAHHPTEIEVAFKVHNINDDNTLVIFQPHTFSRTKLLFDDFVKVLSSCKNLIIYKTYPAREAYDYDGSAIKLSKACKNSVYFDEDKRLFDYVKQNIQEFNKILVVGAGDVYQSFVSQIKNNRS